MLNIIPTYNFIQEFISVYETFILKADEIINSQNHHIHRYNPYDHKA